MAPEISLEPRGSLDHLAGSFAAAGGDALQIRTASCRTAVNLRGAPEDRSLVTDVQRVLGVELPLEPNRWHGDERLAAIWLGPDEWLVVARDEDAARIEKEMRTARRMDPWLSVTDLSHNYTRILLSGPGTRRLLAGGCALDLRPQAFPAGHCAQTVLARSRVLLRAVEEHAFDVWVRNSLAGYVAGWLLQADAASAVAK